MRGTLRPLFCGLMLLLIATGCSTPGQRARQHPATLRRLAPADQQLVLHGRLRPGLSQEAVFIAWGEPDAKRRGGDGKDALEVWVYRHRLTIHEPLNSYDYFGPYQSMGGFPPGLWGQSGYPAGGVGYEGTLLYQPHEQTLVSERVVEFSGSGVDRYKTSFSAWSAPAPALTPPRPEHREPQLAASHAGKKKSAIARTARYAPRHAAAARPAHRRHHAAYSPAGKAHRAPAARAHHSGKRPAGHPFAADGGRR